MACPNPSLTARLRSAATDWNKHLQGIEDPDDAFRQERARLTDASMKRIDDFHSNAMHGSENESNSDTVALLLRSLLSDGQKVEELETEHEITRAKKLELQDKAAESVGSKIVADLIGILGLATIQSLVSAREGAILATKGCDDGTSLAVPDDQDAPPATVGITTRSRTYSARNDGIHRKTTPSKGPSLTDGGDSSLKRKRQFGDCDEQDVKQEKKSLRFSARQTPSFTEKTKSDSVSSLTTSCTRSGDLHQHSNEVTASYSKKRSKLQLRNIRLDVNRRSARVIVQRHPFQTDLCVCLVFFPPGLDTQGNPSFMPALVQLVNRRRTANDPEGPAALGTVPLPVDTHTDLSGGKGGEEKAGKKSESKKG